MFHKPVSGLAGIVFLVCCASIAAAQDFHVETQIYDLGAKSAAGKAPKPQPVGAAESLFHAGKAYDHNRGQNQMTIYEPALQRFVIVDASRDTKTAISFTEIADHLLDDRASAQEYLAKAEKHGLSPEMVEFYKFQLNPEFQVKFTPDPTAPKLVLTSPLVEYHVECATHGSPEVVQAYLEYADWAARLNFVTRRQTMLPGARLAVNEELRQRKLLPVKVTLHTHISKGIHFRADHIYKWKLNGFDMTTMSHWDEKAAAKSTKPVPWEKFFEKELQTAKRK